MTRRLAACFAPALVLAACGERPNESFCDDDGDCAPQVCDLDLHRCVDDEPPDIDGGGGPDAIPDYDGGRCQGPADCPSADQPVCDQQTGFCRGCAEGAGGDAECAAIDGAAPLCHEGSCVACRGSVDCTGDALSPICDGEAHECRGCAIGPAGDSECALRDGTAPRCLDGICVQCTADIDCTSEVCDETTTTCVAEADILYVAKTGNDGGGCGTLAAPCLTVQRGVDEATSLRHIIRVRPGDYQESVVIDSIDIVLVGDGASITPPLNSNVPALRVTSGVAVTAEGLRFRSATGGTGAHGIRCEGGAGLRLIASVVSDNAARGIDADGCDLVVERTRVARNLGGGLRINESDFTLVNNFIVANGNSAGGGSLVGGVLVIGDPPGGAGLIAFNTVAGNAKSATGFAAGFDCATTLPLDATSNIVYGNTPTAAVGGSCTWRHSDIEGGAAGDTNFDVDPSFVSVPDDDYHLNLGSLCRGQGEAGTGVAIDFDGEPRSLEAPDVGADNVFPLAVR